VWHLCVGVGTEEGGGYVGRSGRPPESYQWYPSSFEQRTPPPVLTRDAPAGRALRTHDNQRLSGCFRPIPPLLFFLSNIPSSKASVFHSHSLLLFLYSLSNPSLIDQRPKCWYGKQYSSYSPYCLFFNIVDAGLSDTVHHTVRNLIISEK